MSDSTLPGDLGPLARSFRRDLQARNRSPRTVQTYMEAIDQLGAFLQAEDMPTTASAVSGTACVDRLNGMLHPSHPGTGMCTRNDVPRAQMRVGNPLRPDRLIRRELAGGVPRLPLPVLDPEGPRAGVPEAQLMSARRVGAPPSREVSGWIQGDNAPPHDRCDGVEPNRLVGAGETNHLPPPHASIVQLVHEGVDHVGAGRHVGVLPLL